MNRSYLNPRMRIVWFLLASAKDVGHQPTIDAARRLIRANSRGWRRHHDPKDWKTILELYEELQS